MKNFRILLFIASLAVVSSACEENEIMPAYSKKGTATSTIATITPSKSEAAMSESITITLMYVSPSSDPVKNVVLKVKQGSSDYVTVQTFDAQSEAKDGEIIETITYTTPATKTKLTFDMVITSQKEYPQIVRTTVDVE